MDTNKIKRINELNNKIDGIASEVTEFTYFKIVHELNYYDKKVIEYFQEIVHLIVEIAKEENIKDI